MVVLWLLIGQGHSGIVTSPSCKEYRDPREHLPHLGTLCMCLMRKKRLSAKR